MRIEFEWDAAKARANLRKHGVSFEEAATVLGDSLALYVEDALHPARAVVIGMSRHERVLVVVHAEMGTTAIRLISARLATSHERRRYEEGP